MNAVLDNPVKFDTSLLAKRYDQIGCGTGRLGEHVLKIIGRNGYIVSFELGSSNDLDHFADNSFDVVYINAVFHHIADKSAVLAHINRILKPGGMLGIADPAKEFLSTIRTITQEVLQPYGSDSFNDELVTNDELRSLIASSGFKILKSNYRKNTRYFLN